MDADEIHSKAWDWNCKVSGCSLYDSEVVYAWMALTKQQPWGRLKASLPVVNGMAVPTNTTLPRRSACICDWMCHRGIHETTEYNRLRDVDPLRFALLISYRH